MKIRKIQLKNFKRFSDTTISDLPESVKLVLLVGPNGSGKSSLIDAAQMWRNRSWDETYHLKQIDGAMGSWDQSVHITFYDRSPQTDEQRLKAVYARSAYRNEAEFKLSRLEQIGPALHESRINRLIENDQTVSLNYRRMVSQGFEEVYERADPGMTLAEFREQSIGEIRDALQRLFPGLLLNSLGNPLSNGTFRFDKGESKAFLYKNRFIR